MTSTEYRGQKIATRISKDRTGCFKTEVRINGEFIWAYPATQDALSQTRNDIDGAIQRGSRKAYPWLKI